MAREMTMRLGDAIKVQRRAEDKRREMITEQPDRMSDRQLMNHVCINAFCDKCECIDKCRYGMEAIRRGLR